ncbi:MAG: M16 family metallopeptidase, partial [Minisyncoccales bacterium]
DQSHLILGFRAFSLFDPRRYILEVLAKILGGMMSSRLFLKIRNEKGLAYYIYATNELSPEHGAFEISAGLKNEGLLEGISLILNEVKKISKEGITKKELEKSKENIIGKMNISLESPENQASFYSFQELLEEKIDDKKTIVEKIKKIKEKEVIDLAQEIFQAKNLNLALISPFPLREKIEKILKSF